MANDPDWQDVGDATEAAKTPLRQVTAGRTQIALSFWDGAFHAISGVCNHIGGPLGDGRIDGDYVVCPWHYYKFHVETGLGEPGYEEDRVPAYRVKVEGGRVLVDVASGTPRHKTPHTPHPLARPVVRGDGPVRVVGVSTTNMTPKNPRYSTSDALLDVAIERAAALGAETKTIRLRDLRFRACEGFYSKAARACTWPCSVTQMDKTDQLEQVYEAFVHWADVFVIATPIRWGAASSLYHRMVERMNCVQNQQTIADRVLLKDKVAAFVVTGGQDNVQAVAGQMLGFFAELGCLFPQFPYVAHSRGWSAEDMENNVRFVRESEDLRDGARALAERSVALARTLLAGALPAAPLASGGRKGHEPDGRTKESGDRRALR
jgi:nitrite reductase/ring-hydroxylating ferredoxin subunit/multimeric flavodoxin WrbA